MSDNCNNKIIQNIRTKIRQICANIFAKSNIEEKDGFKIGRIDILRMEQGAYPLFLCAFLLNKIRKEGFMMKKSKYTHFPFKNFRHPLLLRNSGDVKDQCFPSFAS